MALNDTKVQATYLAKLDEVRSNLASSLTVPNGTVESINATTVVLLTALVSNMVQTVHAPSVRKAATVNALKDALALAVKTAAEFEADCL